LRRVRAGETIVLDYTFGVIYRRLHDFLERGGVAVFYMVFISSRCVSKMFLYCITIVIFLAI